MLSSKCGDFLQLLAIFFIEKPQFKKLYKKSPKHPKVGGDNYEDKIYCATIGHLHNTANTLIQETFCIKAPSKTYYNFI